MKPYPPTLREKRRYIKFKVVGNKGEKPVIDALNRAVLSLFGEDGYARANFSIIEYANGKGICRCTHNWLDNVLVTLAFIREIDKKPAKIEVLEVSGTLKKTR